MQESLRTIMKDAILKQKDACPDYPAIQDTYDKMMDLICVLRTEDPYELETMIVDMIQAQREDETGVFDSPMLPELEGTELLLTSLFLLILNGIYLGAVLDIAIDRYFKADFQGTDALIACMIILGIFSLLQEEHPDILKTRLRALLPEAIENQIVAEELRRKKLERRRKRSIPAGFFYDSRPEDWDSEFLDDFDKLISTLDDKTIQTLFLKADKENLATALKFADGSTKKRVFDNIPTHASVMLYENIQYMDIVNPITVKYAVKDIMKLLDQE